MIILTPTRFIPHASLIHADENLRRALLISRGDATVFLTRPISCGFVIATVLIIIVMGLPAIRARREQITD
jgi:TctA family transporter